MSVYKDEKQTLGRSITVIPIGRVKSTKQQREGSQQKEKLSLGNESRKLRLKQIWICPLRAL